MEQYLTLNHTPALALFRNLIGQTNHALITICIGLDGVKNGTVKKGDSFNVSWNPNNLDNSVTISRIFAKRAALSWAIDSLDAYLSYLRKKGYTFHNPEKFPEMQKQSVYSKFKAVTDFYNFPIDLPISLVHLGIQWRNNLVHFNAENPLDQNYQSFLHTASKKEIAERFCGLDANLMLTHFKQQLTPTLKEVASIIQSIYYIVFELDKEIIKNFNLKEHCLSFLQTKKIEIKSILDKGPDKRKHRLFTFLISNGFSISSDDIINKISLTEIEEFIQAK